MTFRSWNNEFVSDIVATAICLCLLASAARAQVVASYNAGTGPNVPDPFFYTESRWLPINVGYPGAPNASAAIVNDGNLGRNAWQIDDSSTSVENPIYSRCLDEAFPGSGICGDGTNARTALENGWRFSTTARYLTDYNTNGIGNMGLSVWLNSKGYFVLLDLLNNDLRATVFTASGAASKIMLTSGGTGPNAYHDFAISYNPATQQVSFEFDGVIRGTTAGLNPAGLHPNTLEWGNLGNGELGKINVHKVEFQIIQPTIAGDYNNDGIVNAADYTVWRNHLGTAYPAADGDGSGTVNGDDYSIWKNSYGANQPSGLGGLFPIPEPAACISISLTAVAVFIRFPRRIAR